MKHDDMYLNVNKSHLADKGGGGEEAALSRARVLVSSAAKDVWRAVRDDIPFTEEGTVPMDCVIDVILNGFFIYADEESRDAAKLLMSDTSNPTAMADAIAYAFDGDGYRV